MGPMETYAAIVAEQSRKAANAARRNKPTMWAYFLSMADGLEAWFADVAQSDEAFAGAALALSQKAERECPGLPPTEAAHLWALSVYARRILRAWGTGAGRVSLAWLRERVA